MPAVNNITNSISNIITSDARNIKILDYDVTTITYLANQILISTVGPENMLDVLQNSFESNKIVLIAVKVVVNAKLIKANPTLSSINNNSRETVINYGNLAVAHE